MPDLGTIDAKYDVAISTACPALDNIVVQTTEQAQRAVEFLRKNKLGFATFIILEKQTQHNMNPIPTPENVPRLFDLIKPKDHHFAPAFYFAVKVRYTISPSFCPSIHLSFSLLTLSMMMIMMMMLTGCRTRWWRRISSRRRGSRSRLSGGGGW
jgi:chromosome segregation ATPase